MKTYAEMDIWIRAFLTSALLGGEWSASQPVRFTPEGRAPGTHWVGGWVGPRIGLDDLGNRKILPLAGLEIRPLCSPALSQSLYLLHYPGSSFLHCETKLMCTVSFYMEQESEHGKIVTASTFPNFKRGCNTRAHGVTSHSHLKLNIS
jgi:hypothetical protein